MTVRRSNAVPATVLAIACLLACVLAVLATNFDFRAFYCSGSIAQRHGNPYMQEPLHTCERALPGDPFKPYSKTTALPVPLPGYAIAAFIPFSKLPYASAARLWTAVLLVSIIVAVACTVSLTGLPAAAVAAAFLLSLCAGSLGLGEIVPVCVAALCVCALMVQRQRWLAASLAAAVCTIEPHIGLPIVVSLAIWVRATRLPLVAIGAVLAVISLLTLGPAANLEYFSTVLPAHALSEIASDAQLSLSVILSGLGVGPHTASTLGLACYIAAVVFGIAAGGVLARTFASNAFVILTPAATSLIGGAFIHVTQMAAAIPLTLLLTARSSSQRLLFIVVAAALAVPWRIVGSPPLVIAAVIVVFYLGWELSDRRIRVGAALGAGALALLLAINLGMSSPPMHARAGHPYSALIDGRYAQASWARYNEQYLSTGTAERWVRRIPTWLALVLLGYAVLGAAYRSDFARQNAFRTVLGRTT